MIKGSILFDIETKEEKELLMFYLSDFFKQQSIDLKKKFIETYLLDPKFRPEKPFRDIFELANVFNEDFLDVNFSPVFSKIDMFKIDKLSFDNSLKAPIIKLYENIKTVPNIDEIHIEIWPFLILFLAKIKESKKVKDVISIIEKAKNVIGIIKKLFEKIHKHINIIPEIKEYFLYIIKYDLMELTFVVNNLNNYKDYIYLIVKNLKELKNNIISLFPSNLLQNIEDKEATLHKIIIIISELGDNIKFTSEFFIKLFPHYLTLLDANEQEILLHYLLKNKIGEKDKFTKDLISSLKLQNIEKYDNNKILEFLEEFDTSFEVFKLVISHIDLKVIKNDEINRLIKVIQKKKKILQEKKD